MSDEARIEHDGVTVIITRSAGLDGARLIFIDGPDGNTEDDIMPDGAPRLRILLNDDPIYAAVDYEPDPT